MPAVIECPSAMNTSLPSLDGPVYSPREERGNVLSAAFGLLAVIVFLPFLLSAALHSKTPNALAGAMVFGAALVLLYGASTAYHALPHGRARRILRVTDHCAIFILIAGTYTPLAAGPLWHAGGPALLILQWSLAATGILIKTLGGLRFHRVTDMIYIGMGWSGIFWAGAFLRHAPWEAMAWIIAGGLAYTGGIVFYKAKGPYTHFIWHLFVFTGTVCDAVAIWGYIL